MPFMIKCTRNTGGSYSLCEYISGHHAPGEFDFIERNVKLV